MPGSPDGGTTPGQVVITVTAQVDATMPAGVANICNQANTSGPENDVSDDPNDGGIGDDDDTCIPVDADPVWNWKRLPLQMQLPVTPLPTP